MAYLNKAKKPIVYVMLSGGVDSSVAALLLKQQGFHVVGVYFKRFKPDGNTDICKADGLSAQKVAEKLDIEFKVWDFEKEYENKVFKYFIRSYNKGETPNPDIVCNREIKFGLFYKKAKEEGADFVASGHYVRLYVKISTFLKALCIPKYLADKFSLPCDKVLLSEAKDKNKDQSYFLSQINPDFLKDLIFPLGNLKKHKVRKIAEKYKLHTAKRKDSQGICFIGREINLKKFLSKYIDLQEGYVLNTKGEIIGTHKGSELYTTGERRGFRIFPQNQNPDMQALYVLGKNVLENTITVGTKRELKESNNSIKSIILKDFRIFDDLSEEEEYFMRIRHRGNKTRIKISKKDATLKLEVLETPLMPTVGQFAAIYDKKSCLLVSGKIADITVEKV